MFETIHDVAMMLDREQVGREASPTGDAVDSQTVKASQPCGGGYDAAKKPKGRKRHVAVDTDGRPPMVNLAPADAQDAAGVEEITKAVRRRWPWRKQIFPNGADGRGKLASLAAYKDVTLKVVGKQLDPKVSQVLPRRWVVERTVGWPTRWRRLVRGYEKRIDVSDTMIHLTMGTLLLRRVAPLDL